MKKKSIEKIPYLTLPKVSRKKDVKYIGRTAIKKVENKMHFFLEVYKNEKMAKDVPVVRIVMNKKDFGTYRPEDGSWTRAKLTSNEYYNALIWETESSRGWGYDRRRKQNILYAPEDLERVKKYFKDIKVWNDGDWWEYISTKQDRICCEERNVRRRRAYERRQAALEDREKHTPQLDEEKLLKYADLVMFHELHYLYYKKHGVRATVACSKCGGVSDERWKPGVSYESQFERMIQEPRMGDFGTCPMCGASGKYMPQGKAKRSHRQTAHLFMGQKYKENGMVFRYIEVGKEWKLGLICGEQGEEMHDSSEQLDGIEIARAYFEPGKKMQMDFHKHNPWTDSDFWDDCNLSGISYIAVKEARVLPNTYENMKGTFLQYSAMEEFARAAGEINPVDYMERYIQTPQIEMLVKLGLIGVVKQLVKCRYGIVADENANRVDAFLGIRKERVKLLIEHKGDTDILEIMQIERRLEQKWTVEQLEQLAEIEVDDTKIAMAIEHTTVQKLLNQISKYAGCEYGTMCSTATGRLRAVTQTYFDYLTMRIALGYDMSYTVYLFPRNLSAAHAKMVMEFNKTEADKRLQETAAKYLLIKKHYRRLRKEFYYEDENFLIRPARDAKEIVMEGRILHHCVGNDTYLIKHNNGTSVILFLRNKKEPEIPYITVEISMNTLNILQWYGAHDKKTDQENMDRWLNTYITRLKCLRDGTLQEAAVEGADKAAMPLLAYA